MGREDLSRAEAKERLAAKLRDRRCEEAFSHISARAAGLGIDLSAYHRLSAEKSASYLARYERAYDRARLAGEEVRAGPVDSLEAFQELLDRTTPLVRDRRLVALFCNRDVRGIRISGVDFAAIGARLLVADADCLLVTCNEVTDGMALDIATGEAERAFELLVWGAAWARLDLGS